MWTLTKTFRFEASHVLVDHDGKCANLHGHSWIGEIGVSASTLIKKGSKRNMVMDYTDLKRLIQPIEDRLDHSHLNQSLETDMPTSEFIARNIYNWLKNSMPEGVKLQYVTINETCTSSCRYEE